MQDFARTKALTENEFFKDNESRIKQEQKKLEKASKDLEKAAEVISQAVSSLEAMKEAGSSVGEIDTEYIESQVLEVKSEDFAEVAPLIMKYQSKALAL